MQLRNRVQIVQQKETLLCRQTALKGSKRYKENVDTAGEVDCIFV